MNIYDQYSQHREFCAEDLEYINYLLGEIKSVERMYKSRVFEEKWPDDLNEIRNNLKQQLEDTAKTCGKELVRYAEDQRQLRKNKTDAVGEREGSRDPIEDVANTQQENLGTPS